MPRYVIRLPWEDFAAKFTGLADAEVGEQVGRCRRTVLRWKHDGGVPFQEADQLAIDAGFHPSEVWGDRYYEAGEFYDGQRCLSGFREAARHAPNSWAQVEGRWHSWWWEADARRVLAEEWVA